MDSNEISVQGDLLKYLESEGYLQDLATTGAKYLQAILEMRSKGLLGPALCFRPEINLTKLKTMSVPLWRMCVEQPALAERLLQQLTMYILAEFLGGRQLFSEFDCEQIFTPLRLSLEADDLEKESLQKNSKQQLVLIKGVLSSYVSPSKYVRSCVTRCRNGECPGAQLKRRPGSWFKGRLCFYCKTEELEMPEERDVGEEVLVTILPLQGLDTAVGGKTSAIQIIFKDDLSAGLTIGSTIQVLCRPAMLQRAPNLTLEACSRVTTELSLSQTKMIPLTFHVEEFYSRYENSPWATVAALAMHFGRDMLPYGCLFNVRMNMILSLASQGSIRPLPLLVLGQENVLASRIMESAAKLSYRSLIHGCQNTISGVARKWEDNRENHCVEAGSLVLASEGVCLVGDWTGLKNEAKTEFKSAIEKGFATVKLPNKPLEFPMKASVWTHCSQLDKKMLKPVIE
ncbi:uncharacterized protein LOC132193671 [Neocloeon triangulifer]|uniref:uncharacterized protein LOC132193671 n=1 Tax=Neocloeon triangulifer TaxID=2078957 RepID=UPI00286EC7BA|nr:uncharacterized protein LOC132193671 [Neocloeon triangulifer]